MKPGARVAAAIEILETISSGAAAEQALTRWARASRYAGSKDRAAVRDHVFDVLRMRETAACLGGGSSARALMLGVLRAQGCDPDDYFNGEGHAPAPLSADEKNAGNGPENCNDLWNLPEELIPELQRSLGETASPTAKALQCRAPITVRVNLAKASHDTAQERLLAEGIASVANSLCHTALTLTDGTRKLRNSSCYLDGLVELQDAASQAVVAAVPSAEKCLDYCAGGGGKALALAADPTRTVFAHDAEPARMRDLQARADRAGCHIKEVNTPDLPSHGPFDLVLCDVPCSGSGAWRRAPDAKWQFSLQRLKDLSTVQDDILEQAARLVGLEGTLVYATCSVFRTENEDRVAAFLQRNPKWNCSYERRFDVSLEGDGFYTAHLTHV